MRVMAILMAIWLGFHLAELRRTPSVRSGAGTVQAFDGGTGGPPPPDLTASDGPFDGGTGGPPPPSFP
jgi:hypothetical protein